jgi:hypothetical protein
MTARARMAAMPTLTAPPRCLPSEANGERLDLWDSPEPGKPRVVCVPRLLTLRVAPCPPIEVETRRLAKFCQTPRVILSLRRNLKLIVVIIPEERGYFLKLA